MINLDKSKIHTVLDLFSLVESFLNSQEDIIITDTFGGSMFPTIISGDRIVIDRAQKDNLVVGDIIAFAQDSRFICHRIKEIKTKENGSEYFVTKGDWNSNSDHIDVELKFIAGKVIYLLRNNIKIDPYNQVDNFPRTFLITTVTKFESARKKCFWLIRKKVFFTLSFLRIMPILKKFIFKISSHRIDYYFNLPRARETFPAVRFISVLIDDVITMEKKFFHPLRTIGLFRISAQIKSKKIAEIEVAKSDDSSQWKVVSFWISNLFSETNLEKKLFGYVRIILGHLNSD